MDLSNKLARAMRAKNPLRVYGSASKFSSNFQKQRRASEVTDGSICDISRQVGNSYPVQIGTNCTSQLCRVVLAFEHRRQVARSRAARICARRTIAAATGRRRGMRRRSIPRPAISDFAASCEEGNDRCSSSITCAGHDVVGRRPFSRSEISTAISRCCNGRRQVPATALRASSISPTRNVNTPMTGSRRSVS
jgi:hypothetical protein